MTTTTKTTETATITDRTHTINVLGDVRKQFTATMFRVIRIEGECGVRVAVLERSQTGKQYLVNIDDDGNLVSGVYSLTGRNNGIRTLVKNARLHGCWEDAEQPHVMGENEHRSGSIDRAMAAVDANTDAVVLAALTDLGGQHYTLTIAGKAGYSQVYTIASLRRLEAAGKVVNDSVTSGVPVCAAKGASWSVSITADDAAAIVDDLTTPQADLLSVLAALDVEARERGYSLDAWVLAEQPADDASKGMPIANLRTAEPVAKRTPASVGRIMTALVAANLVSVDCESSRYGRTYSLSHLGALVVAAINQAADDAVAADQADEAALVAVACTRCGATTYCAADETVDTVLCFACINDDDQAEREAAWAEAVKAEQQRVAQVEAERQAAKAAEADAAEAALVEQREAVCGRIDDIMLTVVAMYPTEASTHRISDLVRGQLTVDLTDRLTNAMLVGVAYDLVDAGLVTRSVTGKLDLTAKGSAKVARLAMQQLPC